MIRILLIISLLSFSAAAIGCRVPHSGPEFDALIQIEKLEADNSYKVEIPNKLENTETAAVILAYAKLPVSKYFIAEHTVALKLEKTNENLSSTFIVEDKEDYTPYIHVYWNARPCGTVANSFILKMPNQAMKKDAAK